MNENHQNDAHAIHTWDDLLNQMISTKNLYEPSRDVERIGSFINGFIACARTNIPNWQDRYNKFRGFIEEKYEMLTHRWDRIIRFHSITEEQAFKEFQKLVEEFRRKDGHGEIDILDWKRSETEIYNDAHMIHTWDDLLNEMTSIKNLYVGSRDVERIGSFINGFIACARTHIPNWQDRYNEFRGFVEEKYEISSVIGWNRIIRVYSTTEEQAFKTFQKLVEEFRQKDGHEE